MYNFINLNTRNILIFKINFYDIKIKCLKIVKNPGNKKYIEDRAILYFLNYIFFLRNISLSI